MKTQRTNFILAMAVTLVMMSCGNTGSGQKDGEKVEAPDVDIHTVTQKGDIEALRKHIAAGTDLNTKDPFGGSSPLITATVFNQPEAAKVLIDAGADLNFKNNDGSTPLHTAAFFCRPDMVKMLLDKGADKTITNNYGATPYLSVAGPYAEVKPAYEMMEKLLGPMGLKLDYAYIEKTRPEIAEMLK